MYITCTCIYLWYNIFFLSIWKNYILQLLTQKAKFKIKQLWWYNVEKWKLFEVFNHILLGAHFYQFECILDLIKPNKFYTPDFYCTLKCRKGLISNTGSLISHYCKHVNFQLKNQFFCSFLSTTKIVKNSTSTLLKFICWQ